MRTRWLIASLLVYSLSVCAQEGATLAEVLSQNHVPADSIDNTALAQPITSFSVADDPQRFAIAYYIKNSGESLTPPLWIRVYDKHKAEWHNQRVDEITAEILDGLRSSCLGSVQAASFIAGYLLFDTHLSPSAGCALIFDDGSNFVRAIPGFVIAHSDGGLVVIQGSVVHFAPTHPLLLSVLDVRTNQLSKIFPPAKDPIRADYISDLLHNLPPDSCKDHKLLCDSEKVETDIDQGPAINDTTQSLAFQADFLPTGFGPQAEDVIGDRQVVYVFRRVGSEWQFREFWKDNFTMKLEDALIPENLSKIFSSK